MHKVYKSIKMHSKSARFIATSKKYFRNTASQVRSSKQIFVHSPFFFFLLPILYAKIFRSRVIGVVWDTYPVKINGKRYDRSFRRRVLDAAEALATRQLDRVIAPSDDFAPYVRAPFTRARLWDCPQHDDPHLLKIRPALSMRKFTGELNILFAGQVNKTRGLQQAISAILEKTSCPIKLTVASSDRLTSVHHERVRIENLGFQSAENLRKIAASQDAGLVALHPNFDGPAFPSKTFDYLAWGLPIIYCGPELAHFCRALAEANAAIMLHRSASETELASALNREAFFHEFCSQPSDLACELVSALSNVAA